jgi:hypothetical protein
MVRCESATWTRPPFCDIKQINIHKSSGVGANLPPAHHREVVVVRQKLKP